MVFDIGTVIAQWQTAGIYDFLLPFLLVFAIVLGILRSTNIIGGNKGLHIIIALVIGLMAVSYNYSTGLLLSDFLRELFPRLGLGLAVLVALLILTGLFISDEAMKKWAQYVLMAIGFVIFLIVILKSFERYGFYSTSFGNYIGWIIGAVLVIGVIIAVATSGPSRDQQQQQTAWVPFVRPDRW
jgi:hypothetical protein